MLFCVEYSKRCLSIGYKVNKQVGSSKTFLNYNKNQLCHQSRLQNAVTVLLKNYRSYEKYDLPENHRKRQTIDISSTGCILVAISAETFLFPFYAINDGMRFANPLAPKNI
uniref:LAGLIDADG homing endonuclease n=1 Tax=Romanomermis culicivorax TaxID=13658 RepID=A0A915IQV2_ROMCU